MERTSSVSKGCFLFNPGSLQPATKHKGRAKTKPCKYLFRVSNFYSRSVLPGRPSLFSIAGYFTKLPLESDKDVGARYEAFLSCWKNIEEKIEVSEILIAIKVFLLVFGFNNWYSKYSR